MGPNCDPTRRAFLYAVIAAPLALSRSAIAATTLEDAFDEIARKRGFTQDTPGLAVLVRRPDRVVLQRCTGLARLDNKMPITSGTMFELASVTKTFTATAILMLHDRGKLSIHDDVRKHLPELPRYDEQRPIALTDLLHHTSGLPDYMSLEEPPAGAKGYLTNEDYVGEFAGQLSKHPLTFATGQKYVYNNTNYMLLGLIVARVSKKSFGTFFAMKFSLPREWPTPSSTSRRLRFLRPWRPDTRRPRVISGSRDGRCGSQRGACRRSATRRC